MTRFISDACACFFIVIALPIGMYHAVKLGLSAGNDDFDACRHHTRMANWIVAGGPWADPEELQRCEERMEATIRSIQEGGEKGEEEKTSSV